jgi:N-acetylmuramoyl-L-alanine amidase
MRRFALLFLLIQAVIAVRAQEVFLKMQQPARTEINTGSSKTFFHGRTCVGCKVMLNEDSVYVYATGAFAVKRILKPGKSTYVLTTTDTTGQVIKRVYNFYFNPPPPARATTVFRIDYVNVTPRVNALISAGDTLKVKLKGLPGCKAYWMNNTPIPELSAAAGGGVEGIYAGYYVVQPSDSMLNGKLSVFLKNKAGGTAVLQTPNHYTYQRNELLYGRTISDMTYLTSSPEGDRLGPEKIGYLDKDVLLHIIGKQDDFYKVRLSNQHTAFIREDFIDTVTLTEPAPLSIVSETKVWSEENYDYVSVNLSDKLPFLSTQDVNPGKITIDIHGAYSEPDLVPQLQSTPEIGLVTCKQVEHDVFRLTITLRHRQPWGYKMYYNGNQLIVRVKHQPANLQLKNLTIALDAGHGGSNVGAVGAMGVYEKELTLSFVWLLKAALEKEGTKVLTTRLSDQTVENQDRLYNYRQLSPDLLISIHLNSSVNPVDVRGTATYYKLPFCEPLCRNIHNRLLETGLHDFGNNPGFNFILNNPTEFPDVLIETLFLSNPEDEMHALDPQFRQLMVDKIMQGLRDYLAECDSSINNTMPTLTSVTDSTHTNDTIDTNTDIIISN